MAEPSGSQSPGLFSPHETGKKSEKPMGLPSARLPLPRTGLLSGFSFNI